SLFNKKTSSSGALIGIISGSLIVIFWKPTLDIIGLKELSELYQIIPGFIGSIALILFISYLFPEHHNTKKFSSAEKAFQDLLSKK
ncbi:MAG: sodium:proline symporter, partial [Psittacicella sp.]